MQKATFQGLLATDFQRSFAVFIYYSNGRNTRFSDHASIGYVTRDGCFTNHEAHTVSCLNYPASSSNIVVYEISGKYSVSMVCEVSLLLRASAASELT